MTQYTFPVVVGFIFIKKIFLDEFNATQIGKDMGDWVVALSTPVVLDTIMYFTISYFFYNLSLSYYYLYIHRREYSELKSMEGKCYE